MAQKYKSFNFDFDLGLSNDLLSVPKSGVAKNIKNVYAKEKIISNTTFEDFANSVDKINATALALQLNEIADIENIFGFETYSGQTHIEYLIFATSDYKIYYYNLHDINRQLLSLNSIQLTSRPRFEQFINDGVNQLLITSKTDEMWVWDGINNPYEVLDAPKIASLTVGLDRAFVTTLDSPYSIFYSSNNDPTEWTMSGDANQIAFSDDMGKVLKVVSLGSYVYVIRDLGIIKISGGKSSDNFTFSKIYFSSGKIYDNTICCSGDNIVFMSSQGMYKFDGLNAKKLFNSLDGKVDLSLGDSAICYDGKYHLLTSDKLGNQIMVIADLNEEIIHEIIHMQIDLMFVVSTSSKRFFGVICDSQENAKDIKIICKNASNINKNVEFMYRTVEIRLDPVDKIKTLKKLKFLCKTDALIKIITDLDVYELKVKASEFYQEKLLSIVCNSFSIEFIGESGADISNISVDYSYEGDY